MADLATRTAPLARVHGSSASVRLTPAQPAERISLRARPEEVAALSAALLFGCALQNHDLCTGLCCGNGRRQTRHAASGDHHIELVLHLCSWYRFRTEAARVP